MVEIKVTTNSQESEEYHQKALNKLSKRVKIPGFRPGHVPLNLAKDIILESSLHEEIINENLPVLLSFALKETALNPLIWPKAKIENLEPLSITFSFPTKPEVKLGDYKKMIRENFGNKLPKEDSNDQRDQKDKIMESLSKNIEIKDAPEEIEKDPSFLQFKMQWILEELAKEFNRPLEKQEDVDYILNELTKIVGGEDDKLVPKGDA